MLPLRLHRHRPPSRKRQAGFLRLSMLTARWGGSGAFRPQDLFRAGEAGAHFEAYNPNTLLARRNLLLWSEALSNAAWGKVTQGTGLAPVVTDAYPTVADPNGTFTASRLQLNKGAGTTANDRSELEGPVTTTPGANYTISVWLRSTDGVSSYAMQFSFSGAAPASVVNITPQWQQFTLTQSAVDAARGFRLALRGTAGTSDSADVLVWHPQHEKGAAVTSYQKVTDWYTEYMAAALESIGMWQDSAGTLPVTAVEQPVGLWMDSKAGKAWVRGVNIVSKGTFDGGDISAWTGVGATLSALNGGMQVTNSAAAEGFGNMIAAIPKPTGTYEVTFDVLQLSGSVGAAVQFGGVRVVTTGAGSQRVIVTGAGTPVFGFGTRSAAAGAFVVVDNVVVREVVGNHATQATSGQRPILSARYNLLTKTEQFTDAVWQKLTSGAGTAPVMTDNFGVAPDGTNTAARLQAAITGTTSADYSMLQSTAVPVMTGKVAVWLKSNTGAPQSVYYRIDATDQTHTVQATSQWQKFEINSPATSLVTVGVRGTATGVAAVDVLVWHPDLRTADDASKNIPAYQRVNTATDYDSDGFPHYLKFDGSDDGLATGTIDFTPFDKVSVWAAVAKLSDAATGAVVESSATSTGNAGTFALFGPPGATSATFMSRSRGTVDNTATSPASYAAPITALLTHLGDISGTTNRLRVNGVQVVSNSSDQGTGTFTAQPLNIGRRGGASIPFNGRIHSLTVRASSTPASESFITKMNRYAANLMAVTI